MKISLRLLQYIFFFLFVLSVLAGFMTVRFQENLVAQSELLQEDGGSSVEEVEKLLDERAAGFDASVVMMLVSLAGFGVSTVMNVRRDRREAREAALAMQQKELELEKLRMELETLKKRS